MRIGSRFSWVKVEAGKTAKEGRMGTNTRKFRLALTWLMALGLLLSVFGAVRARAAGPICTVDDDGPADYTTIQAAVDDAGCTTINVAAGTYNEDITVGKDLTLLGAQAGVDPRGGRVGAESEIVGVVEVTSAATDVVFDGFKFTSPTRAFTPRGFNLHIESQSSTIRNNILVAEENAGHTYAGYLDFGGIANTTVRQNSFSGDLDAVQEPNVILLGITGAGTVTVAENEMHDVGGGGGIGVMSNNAGAVIDIENNDIENTGDGIWVWNAGGSTFDALSITSNNIYQCAKVGVKIVGPIASVALIEGSTITNNATGIRLEGGATGVSILGNDILTNGIDTGILVKDGAAAANEAHFNNIVGNDIGVKNEDPDDTFDAENNWWGANDGPSASPGSGDKISDYVDADPWLVLKISANPDSILANGTSTSTITADMTKNSAGFDTSILGYIPDGTEINFTTDKGSIGSLTTTKTTTNGKAQATLTSSTTPETATVSASAPPHTATATDTTTVDFTAVPPGPSHTLTLTADPTSIVANGRSTSTLTATVKDESEDPVADGTKVYVSTDLGTLDGAASRDMVVKTTTDGVATAVLTCGRMAGVATVEAASDGATDSTEVTMVPPPPRRREPPRGARVEVGRVRFVWGARRGAVQYHLRVWQIKGGSWDLVIDKVLTRRWFNKWLSAGNYRWEVRTGLGGNVWGPWPMWTLGFRVRPRRS